MGTLAKASTEKQKEKESGLSSVIVRRKVKVVSSNLTGPVVFFKNP